MLCAEWVGDVVSGLIGVSALGSIVVIFIYGLRR